MPRRDDGAGVTSVTQRWRSAATLAASATDVADLAECGAAHEVRDGAMPLAAKLRRSQRLWREATLGAHPIQQGRSKFVDLVPLSPMQRIKEVRKRLIGIHGFAPMLEE